MKISLNAIRAFNAKYECADDPAPDGVNKMVERIGTQLAAVENTIPIGKKYLGIVVVKVVDCHKHGNSDHLNVCQIDDGGVVKDVARGADGYVQVVCGAANVRAGLTVAWLPPGSTVPSSFDNDPFVLTIREIRGEMSNGMLASPKELALGDNHEGILEIDGDIVPGTSFADQYGLTDDVVIDMENKMFTHRPDCFGMLGVSREIAGIQGQRFTSPEWYRTDAAIDAPETPSLKIAVRNEIPDLVSRYVVVPLSGITVKPSPVWLQVELSRLGIRPISNVVDLTNYHMLLTGQPLHAYDYDKVVALDTETSHAAAHATIVIRKPHDAEKLLLLNGKMIEPRTDAIIIAAAKRAIGLGGVMGGSDTEVDNHTKNIILECASFDMYSIRRASMDSGIFSDAVTRFNKGQSPLQNMAVLAHIVDDMRTIAGGQVSGAVVDDNHIPADVQANQSLNPPLRVERAFINSRLGLQLSPEIITSSLVNVEFKVRVEADSFNITAPFWRSDIEIPEDIVEEVGRLYSFDKLPLELPKRDLTPAVKNKMFELKAAIRDGLSRAGANELLCYSFVHGNLIDKVGQDRQMAYKLSNALSPDLQYYRQSITPSLLDKVHANIKAGYDEFAVFEIGKVHIYESGRTDIPTEFERVALVFVANNKAAQNYSGAAYYQARIYLSEILKMFGITDALRFEPLNANSYIGSTKAKIPQYAQGRSASLIVGKVCIGEIGEYTAAVRKALKLPDFTAGFEVDIRALGDLVGGAYSPTSRYPKLWQDICLRVASDVSYQQLYDLVRSTIESQRSNDMILSLQPIDIYQRPEDLDHKQITFRLQISSYEKTMVDAAVNTLFEAVTQAAATAFSAERI